MPRLVPGFQRRRGDGRLALPRATFAVAADLPAQDEYEVRVDDRSRGRRLVAAIEIVSPANKDRLEPRRAFIAKCAALLQERVSVAMVDLVTKRHFSLYQELLELIGQNDPNRNRLAGSLCRGLPGDTEGPGMASRNLVPLSCRSADCCRRCHYGSATTLPSRWSWRRATRKRAGRSNSGATPWVSQAGPEGGKGGRRGYFGGIMGSAATCSAGGVLAALIPVPVVPPFGGPTARLRRAGRGPRIGAENNALRPTPRFKTWNTIPPGAIRAGGRCDIPRGYYNRLRL